MNSSDVLLSHFVSVRVCVYNIYIYMCVCLCVCSSSSSSNKVQACYLVETFYSEFSPLRALSRPGWLD